MPKAAGRVLFFGILVIAAAFAVATGAVLLLVVVAALLLAGYFHASSPVLDFILGCVEHTGNLIGSKQPVAIVLAWTAAVFFVSVALQLLLRRRSVQVA